MTPSEQLQYDAHATIPWQFLLTIRTPRITDDDEARRFVQQRVLRHITDRHKSCVCGYGVLNYLNNSHVHVLIRAYKPEAIAGLTTDSLKGILKANGEPLGTIKGAVDVKAIHDNEGAVAYIHRNFPEGSGKGAFIPFGLWLLEKLYIRYPLPIDPNPTA